jgi:tetratricopeptide (TPR) repeat protein
MSEMLGNRYFLSRKFDKAIPELEFALKGVSEDEKIKKKLIICYIQVGQIEKALPLFEELLFKDPFIIINTDPYYDDCPCPSLVDHWEDMIRYREDSMRIELVALGMLYLYCDIHKSVDYFQKAQNNIENDNQINRILSRLIEARDQVGQPS